MTERTARLSESGLDWRIVGGATARHGVFQAPAGIAADTLLSRGVTGGLEGLHDTRTGPPPSDTHDLIARTVGETRRPNHRIVVVENTPLGLEAGEPGLGHVRAALDSGADVITANKSAPAFAYRELETLARRRGVSFLFEGTVLDGLPILSLVRETLPTSEVLGFRGIVNTTTNYLLSAMADGEPLADALGRMQAAGIAEADPANDIEGWDAAAKTAVLANVLMDAGITPHDIERRGLSSLAPDAALTAKRRGRRLKLVAAATRQGERVITTVGPEEVEATDPLAALEGTAKGLALDVRPLGTLHLSKPTSGPTHTAYALVTDLITIHRRTRIA